MPTYDQSDLMIAPESGWPDITSERLSDFGKNETVVELLKHLPYLNMEAPAQSTSSLLQRSRLTTVANHSQTPFGKTSWQVKGMSSQITLHPADPIQPRSSFLHQAPIATENGQCWTPPTAQSRGS